MIADARYKGYELSKVAPVQLKLADFLAADVARQFRRLGLYLRDVGALYNYFNVRCAHFHADIGARFLADTKHNALRFIFFEAAGCDRDVVRTNRKRGKKVVAAAVALGGFIRPEGRVRERHLRAGNGRTGRICDCACNGRRVLCKDGSSRSQDQYHHPQPAKRGSHQILTPSQKYRNETHCSGTKPPTNLAKRIPAKVLLKRMNSALFGFSCQAENPGMALARFGGRSPRHQTRCEFAVRGGHRFLLQQGIDAVRHEADRKLAHLIERLAHRT